MDSSGKEDSFVYHMVINGKQYNRTNIKYQISDHCFLDFAHETSCVKSNKHNEEESLFFEKCQDRIKPAQQKLEDTYEDFLKSECEFFSQQLPIKPSNDCQNGDCSVRIFFDKDIGTIRQLPKKNRENDI